MQQSKVKLPLPIELEAPFVAATELRVGQETSESVAKIGLALFFLTSSPPVQSPWMAQSKVEGINKRR